MPYVALEDGFLRSFGSGDRFPPLSLIVDKQGVYYDSTQPSALEHLLESNTALVTKATAAAMTKLQALQLSKYNHAPALAQEALRPNDRQRVLVIDQTAGDLSVALGGATAQTFAAMLAAALDENPEATIYVKTHPEVSSGRKRGYLTHVQADARIAVLREVINPQDLIAHMDKVYVVTSGMGFEALLAGKPVSCFGLPWYAGWGATDDRQANASVLTRRTRKRSVDELFAAAYLHYTHYLDPVTHERGDIFDVMDWLARQREISQRFAERMICVGFRRWKAFNLRPMLSLSPDKVHFVPDAAAAARLKPQGQDCLVFWGAAPPEGLRSLAEQCHVRLLRMEDGFVRSIGLGSDLIAPQSFVLDASGIYFDASGPSDLEHLLNTRYFDALDLERARKVRAFIVEHGITKYNQEPREPVDWPNKGRQVVLVPGQVEDDASIRFGSPEVQTNLDLLRAARSGHPDAFIVFKPHPDVQSGNRKGRLALSEILCFADHVETRSSVTSCIAACDTVHTMTSLTGFDALLREKKVVVHGLPFYAGWGLTEDRLQPQRRLRSLTLDELVAGALLHYPLYWDPDLKGYTSCEAVLHRILEQRNALEAKGRMAKLRSGFLRRQLRKARVLLISLLHKQ